MKNTGSVDLREGPVLKKIILFALPILISNVVQRLFNIADMIIAGKCIGNQALASIGATSTVSLLLVLVFTGFSAGSGIVASHSFGANDERSLSHCLHTSLYVSAGIGVFLFVVGQFLAEPILRFMNVPEDVFDTALQYVKIYFLCVPANMCYNSLYSISRAVGETKKPMYFLIFSGALNVLFNVVFVVAFRWGVAGIAYATVLSTYLSFICVFVMFLKGIGNLKFKFKEKQFSSVILKKIIRLSLPTGFNYLLVGITDSIVQASVNIFGSSYIAGYTAGSNVFALFSLATLGINQATMTFVAQNYGIKNYDRIRYGYKISNRAVSILSVGLIVLFVTFRRPLLMMYTTDEVAIKAGEIYTWFFGCSAIAYFVKDNMAAVLNGLGKTFHTMMVSVIVIGFLRIVWNLTVFVIFKTFPVLLLNYTVSWVTAYIVLKILVKKELDKLN